MSDPRRIPLTAEERQAIKSADLQRRLAKVEKMGGPVGGTAVPDHASNHATGGSDELTPTAIGALASSDSRIPTTDQKAAMVGTNGSPSSTNKFVTDSDPRVAASADLSRQTLTQTITVAAGAEASVNLALATGFTIWKITTDKAARIRLYSTTADRTADTSRSASTAPTAGVGLITEVITTASLLSVPMTPPQSGASLESPASSDIPALIKNNGATSDVVLTITWTRAEA